MFLSIVLHTNLYTRLNLFIVRLVMSTLLHCVSLFHFQIEIKIAVDWAEDVAQSWCVTSRMSGSLGMSLIHLILSMHGVRGSLLWTRISAMLIVYLLDFFSQLLLHQIIPESSLQQLTTGFTTSSSSSSPFLFPHRLLTPFPRGSPGRPCASTPWWYLYARKPADPSHCCPRWHL